MLEINKWRLISQCICISSSPADTPGEPARNVPFVYMYIIHNLPSSLASFYACLGSPTMLKRLLPLHGLPGIYFDVRDIAFCCLSLSLTLSFPLSGSKWVITMRVIEPKGRIWRSSQVNKKRKRSMVWQTRESVHVDMSMPRGQSRTSLLLSLSLSVAHSSFFSVKKIEI